MCAGKRDTISTFRNKRNTQEIRSLWMLGGESHGQWGKQTFLLQLERKKEKQEGKKQMREIYLLQR